MHGHREKYSNIHHNQMKKFINLEIYQKLYQKHTKHQYKIFFHVTVIISEVDHANV